MNPSPTERLALYKRLLEDMNCLEAWEIVYLHERAIRDCLFYMHDVEPPQDEYGQLTPVQSQMLMRFYGKKFQALLATTGHTAADFTKCTCHEHYVMREQKTY